MIRYDRLRDSSVVFHGDGVWDSDRVCVVAFGKLASDVARSQTYKMARSATRRAILYVTIIVYFLPRSGPFRLLSRSDL